MAKSKSRKKYVPKPVVADTFGLVSKKFAVEAANRRYEAAGKVPISETVSLRILNLVYLALASLKTGKGTVTDWDTVAHALNMSELLATELKIGYDYLSTIRRGQQAHNNCGARYITKSAFGYSGPEMKAMNLALEVHDQQLEIATVEELEALADKIDQKILAKEIDLYAAKGIVELEDL